MVNTTWAIAVTQTSEARTAGAYDEWTGKVNGDEDDLEGSVGDGSAGLRRSTSSPGGSWIDVLAWKSWTSMIRTGT